MDVMVEYTIVDGMESEADAVRGAFLEAVASWKPEQFTYRVMQRGDTNSWVHLAWLDSPTTQQELFDTDFFKTFNEGMQKISGGSVNATPLVEWSRA